jgi:hypothetical protein
VGVYRTWGIWGRFEISDLKFENYGNAASGVREGAILNSAEKSEDTQEKSKAPPSQTEDGAPNC